MHYYFKLSFNFFLKGDLKTTDDDFCFVSIPQAGKRSEVFPINYFEYTLLKRDQCNPTVSELCMGKKRSTTPKLYFTADDICMKPVEAPNPSTLNICGVRRGFIIQI